MRNLLGKNAIGVGQLILPYFSVNGVVSVLSPRGKVENGALSSSPFRASCTPDLLYWRACSDS